MARPGLEVADVFRRYGEAYRQRHDASLSAEQLRVMTAIELCRTAALGGHVEQCDKCRHQRICYNSCRNRHCPKCQSMARAQWLEERQSEILAVPYFHLVFTLPPPIAAIAYQNKQRVYNILFQATSETLRTIAADPRHLGAEIGFFAVLHTWGQNLVHHPHLHVVAAGGGLSFDGTRWISCRPNFFLSVRVLSKLFRALFLKYLERAFDAGELQFFSSLESLRAKSAFLRYLVPVRKTKWVVYAKGPPLDGNGPEDVLRYAARYIHRVAISNNRLLDIDNDKVRFRWKDYRNNNQHKTMELAAEEFILLHVLPEGFRRVRYYGFLANCHRDHKLARCRQLLQCPAPDHTCEQKMDYRDRYEELTGKSLRTCPACQKGHMLVVEVFEPGQQPTATATRDQCSRPPPFTDTS